MDRKHRIRIELLTLGLLGVFGLLFIRLYYIQQVRHEHYRAIADRQHLRRVTTAPLRGAIHDRNGVLLAISRQAPSIWANPARISDPAAAAARLAALLPVPRELLRSRLARRDRHFVWVARHVTADLAAGVQALAEPGVGIRMEPRRSYPQRELAAHVLGFCGTDQQGLEGVERAWDRTLAGTPGSALHVRDGRLRFETIHLPGDMGSAPEHGADLVLTIDLAVQRIAEQALDEACAKFQPRQALALVLQVGSGEVLALAQRPGFDPNHFGRASSALRRNGALLDLYAPGSTIKPLVACFALAEGLFDEGTEIDCHNGRWRYRGRTIADHKPLGRQTFAGVLVHSSNIGMAQIALQLGGARLERYLSAAGFGRAPRELRYPGVPAGQLKARPGEWDYWSLTSVAFGYEIMASPLQLAAGINMLASGGVATPPRLVRMVRRADGSTQLFGRRVVTEQIVPRNAAQRICRILGRVVEEGTGRPARVSGLKIGGKTGTAKKLEADGRWSDTRYRSSFIGFAPLDRPAVTVMVLLDEAQVESGKPYGGRVAGPATGRILQQTLAYLGVSS